MAFSPNVFLYGYAIECLYEIVCYTCCKKKAFLRYAQPYESSVRSSGQSLYCICCNNMAFLLHEFLHGSSNYLMYKTVYYKYYKKMAFLLRVISYASLRYILQ